MTKAEFIDKTSRRLAERFPTKTADQCRRLAEAIWRQYALHGFDP